MSSRDEGQGPNPDSERLELIYTSISVSLKSDIDHVHVNTPFIYEIVSHAARVIVIEKVISTLISTASVIRCNTLRSRFHATRCLRLWLRTRVFLTFGMNLFRQPILNIPFKPFKRGAQSCISCLTLLHNVGRGVSRLFYLNIHECKHLAPEYKRCKEVYWSCAFTWLIFFLSNRLSEVYTTSFGPMRYFIPVALLTWRNFIRQWIIRV